MEGIVENTNLEKAKEIAKKKTEEIKRVQEAEKKSSEESKAIEAKKQTESSEAVKTEGKEIVAEAEKQAENDARILSSKDEELSDDDNKRKEELIKAKESKESPEEKLKRTQEATQKRIDEVIGELKAERAAREKDNKKIAELESQLESLTKPKKEEDKASKVKQLVEKQIADYLKEDENVPRETKREMSREELEDWLLEDYVAATEWLTDRNIRRNKDKASIISSLDSEPKKRAEEFINKQQESLKKLVARYPEVMPSPERMEKLKGKKPEEIDGILASENEDYKLMLEIINEDKKKYLESIDGPEQVMAEMDRRKGKTSKTITLTEDELQQRIKDAAVAEAQRIANLDEGITSSGGKKVETKEKKSEFRLKQEEIARKAGVSIEQLDNAIKRRESIGVIASTAEDFNKD